MSDVDTYAKIIWDYHHVGQTLKKADAILALGSNDLRVAVRAAELYRGGWAPLIIFSGGVGRLTAGMWNKSEAEVFADEAMKNGVPRDKILIEPRSTNTGENVQFTKRLLDEKGIDPRSFILVQKPYMERRTFATFRKVWPEKEFTVTSPQISFENYPTATLPKDLIINIMVGDLQRIREYPARGFQIEQEIPVEVWAAFEKIVSAGYTQHLIND
jgi:uncharacterized SAM-binding protein YcdF (DUF218 family)